MGFGISAAAPAYQEWRMSSKSCPSGRPRSAAQNKAFEAVPAIDDRVGNLPTWALPTNQNAARDDLRPRLQTPVATVPPPLGSFTTPVPLLTVKEAATLLRVSAKTIRRLIEREELQAVRIGRSVRLRSADVLRIIEQGK
jgi:excisionase family DNA binding protein